MAKDVEVRTKLKLEDLTSSVLKQIRGEFDQTDQKQQQTQSHFKEFGSLFASQFAATNLAPLIGQVTGLGRSLIEAGIGGQEADKAIAGMIATSQGVAWDEALSGGQRYGDMLDAVALKSMQAGDDVEAGFQKIIEITGASDKGLAQALTTTESLAVVSNKLHKSTASLAAEYSFMSEGTLKTKGQLFQLLQQTGIFGTETKKASENWAKLTDAKRIELLQYGVSKVASSLSQATPTMGDLITKAQNLAGILSEKFGQGFIEELVPGVMAMIDELEGGRDVMGQTADEMGREVGKSVKEAAKVVKDGYAYVREHYAEIKTSVVEGFTFAKGVVSWIIDHKEALAFAFGAKMALGLGQAALGSSPVSMGSNLVKGAAGLGSAVAPALAGGSLGSTVASLTVALGGATVGIAALGVGIVALGGAAYATSKIVEELDAEQAARDAALANIEEAAYAGDVARTKGLIEAMSLLGGNVNSLGDAIGQLSETTVRTYQSLMSIAETTANIDVFNAEQIKNEIDLATRGIADAYARGSTDTSKAGQDYASNMYANQTAILIDAYNQASLSGNGALQLLAAQTLASSRGTQEAFLAAGKEVEGGFGALADVVMAGGSQFADFAVKLRNIAPKSTPTPAAPTMNIGTANFNIKQDFRDTDPDRIAVVFRKDVAKAAARRYTVATGSFFGT